MRKEIKPGDSFSIRIPIDTKSEIIHHLNEDRSEKLNKYVVDTLFSKIEERIENKNKLIINLPFSLSAEQRKKLEQSIISLLNIMEPEQEQKTTETTDYSIYDGLMEFD